MSNARIQFSLASEDVWNAYNPRLKEGEIVTVLKDNKKVKLVQGKVGGSTYSESTVIWDENLAETTMSRAEAAAVTATEQATAANDSASAAAVSQSAAATSATNAKASENAAANSETNAKASATAAKNSATSAASSASTASTQAGKAADSAIAAAGSATQAGTFATTATDKAIAADKSATAAAASAVTASDKASEAATSATNAAGAAEKAQAAKDDALNSQKLIEKYKALWFDSIAAMKAEKSLKPGAVACTLGYYSPNDGGGGTYIIRAKDDGDVDDGGSVHELANGCVAELVVENGKVNVKQFGAQGDGVTDDSDAFIRCCNKVTGLYVPNGSYKLSSPVDISNISFLEGNGIDTVICGVLNSISNQGYRIIKNLKFASLNDSRAEAGLKGIFTLAAFENITFIGCKIAMDFTYGTWINVFRNISIQYCDIGINAPDQFNAIAFQGCIQHCTIAIKLNNQARQLNFYDCDFEMNNTVFVLKDAMALNLKNTYIEYNNKIFDFAALETAFFNSDIIVNNCYIYNDAENITDGWLVTMPSHSDSQLDVKATTLKLSNNNINIVNTSEFPKPFLITGNYTSSYLAISLENNVYRFNASVFPVTTYFDLFKMENGKEYSAYPLSIASDFPYYKYSNLYWYSSSALNKEDQRFSRKFHMLGYIELQKTGSEFLSLDMQETLFPYQTNFRGMCDLVYSDGSVDRVSFKTDSHNIHIYNADANKTTSKIVFDVTYYC